MADPISQKIPTSSMICSVYLYIILCCGCAASKSIKNILGGVYANASEEAKFSISRELFLTASTHGKYARNVFLLLHSSSHAGEKF